MFFYHDIAELFCGSKKINMKNIFYNQDLHSNKKK
jgi:hypothetical protein